jgi:RNA polymerase-binding transcription factor DksA
MDTANVKDVRCSLLRRRAELADRLGRIERDIERATEPLVADLPDQAIQRENDAALDAIGSVALVELHEIDDAIRRIDAGTYGVCTRCRRAIEPARLAAVPQASTCTRCALQ